MNNYFSALKEETAATFELRAVDAYRRSRGTSLCDARYQYGDVARDMEQLHGFISNDSNVSTYFFVVRDCGTWLTSSEELLSVIKTQEDNYDLYTISIYIKNGGVIYKPLSYEAVRDGKKVLKGLYSLKTV